MAANTRVPIQDGEPDETAKAEEAIDEVLLREPFDDPKPDPDLSANVDHYLYGAARRSRRRR